MIDEVLNSLDLRLSDIRRLAADLTDKSMLSQPIAGMNHAAWNIGHIACSFQAIGGELGLPPWLPEEWNERFGRGSGPDSESENHPDKDELMGALDDGAERIVRRLKTIRVEDLSGPLPDERYRDLFPTLGHAVLDILIGHTSVHVGQIRAWRRAMGLPPV